MYIYIYICIQGFGYRDIWGVVHIGWRDKNKEYGLRMVSPKQHRLKLPKVQSIKTCWIALYNRAFVKINSLFIIIFLWWFLYSNLHTHPSAGKVRKHQSITRTCSDQHASY